MSRDTRISAITTTHYGLSPSGNFTVMGEGFTSVITMTEEEAREITALAFRFFEARQKSIGDSIAKATLPNLLAAPVDAEFTEVETVDDISF